MIFVDTGFFLAVSQPRDALHARATAWAQAVTEPLLVTEYVLWETVNGLSKSVDRPRAHLLLRQVRSGVGWSVVPASAELLEAGLRLHAERADKDWSLTDCASFIVMRERGILRALTYDHHFEQAGFEALLRLDPP
ncbi:MAG TPA: PIN domain-containing protein [Gemmataceae bacterium]|nr:PIN domain-containing protein [Gemmataceae bacterium]